MSTCKLKLYNNMILPSRNMRIDNIESYLGGEDKTGSYLKYSSPNFQYQRIALSMQIKVNMDQSQITDPSINYASIFQGGRFFYFFIMKVEQVARKTVRLYLSMDTINTFWGFLKWSDQTRIEREHVDRYKDKISGVGGNYYRRSIDRYQEGFNPAKDAFTKNALVPDAGISGTNNPCYLVWLANSEITPDKQSATPIIPTFCYDARVKIRDEQTYSATSKNLADLVGRKEVVYVTSSQTGASLTLNSISTTGTLQVEKSMLQVDSSTRAVLRAFRMRVAGGFTVDCLYYTGDVYPYSYAKTETITLAQFALVGDLSFATYADNTDYYRNLQSLDVMDQLSNRREVNIGTIPAQRSVSFADLDRSSTRIVKILKLPAPPLDVKAYGSNLSLVPGYNLIRTRSSLMKCYIDGADNHKLGNTLKLAAFKQLGTTIDPKAAFNAENESKLYSSEFYDITLQFHDYNYSMQLEQMNYNISPDALNTMKIQFTVSAALTGDCRLEIENFNSIFTPRYNNQQYMFFTCYEVPQYNSSWINYLRNGYNYDVEQRKITNKNAIISGVLSLVGAIPAAGRIGSAIGTASSEAKAAGKAAYNQVFDPSKYYDPDEVVGTSSMGDVITAYDKREFYSYNPPSIESVRDSYLKTKSLAEDASKKARRSAFAKNFSPFGGVGALVVQQGIQAVSSAVSTLSSINSNNLSYANSLRSQQAGTPAALSTVPYDIQPDDKVWIIESYPRAEIRNQIAKTFHLMGYSHPVTELPDFTSRYWFNFVQCSPVFLGKLDVIHPEYEDDIKQRFEAGVTVMHQHDGEYDMDQKYENWESKLFPSASSGSDIGGRL